MPATVSEQFGGITIMDSLVPQAEVKYIVIAVDYATAQRDLRLESPLLLDVYGDGSLYIPRESITVRELESDESWEGTVRYAGRSEQTAFTFETAGGTHHIRTSLETVHSYAGKWQWVESYEPGPGEIPGPNLPTAEWVSTEAPRCSNAIGWDGENVNGCEIVVPIFNFSETWYGDNGDVTTAYKNTLAVLTGRTNEAPFRGYSAGEVLFLGARGMKRGMENWEINFSFAVSKNRSDIVVGEMTGIIKKGWEYLWIKYRNGTSQDLLVPVPEAVYVERVYESGDFSQLLLGD